MCMSLRHVPIEFYVVEIAKTIHCHVYRGLGNKIFCKTQSKYIFYFFISLYSLGI